ncbi:MAG TPA: nucleotidyltransferase domain-containing protein [Ramlibacter sp.]|uniref:nucleotidyltransferase family protein n=1 Tax=Ramlibacter sp. TaxID=1917967 RepID=UPI002C856BF4|nr:nucleotidyltransferase domain-containing protein [Ramlibacter sp.]HVZ43176.1 nucleotidyltransferase domain-containing protein [Ramlibacter sp.]
MSPLIDQKRDEVAALCRRTHARRLDVFGSVTRSDFDPQRSDIDFLVEFEDVPPREYADAYFGLKEGLEALFGRPVDLLTPSNLANPYFRRRVIAELKTVYAS